MVSAGNGLVVHTSSVVGSPPHQPRPTTAWKCIERNRRYLEGRVVTPVMIQVHFLLSMHFAHR